MAWRFNMNTKQFKEFVANTAKNYGVTCMFVESDHVNTINEIPCSGYFDPRRKILAVALKAEKWEDILAHEFCHMLQWVDGLLGPLDQQKEDTIDAWLGGADVENYEELINWTRDIELDCERRTVDLAAKLGLGFIDTSTYIREANAYIQFYNWMKKNRKWTDAGRPIYNSKEVVALCPDTFDMDYNNIPEELEMAMTQWVYQYESGVVQVYEALSDENKKKFGDLPLQEMPIAHNSVRLFGDTFFLEYDLQDEVFVLSHPDWDVYAYGNSVREAKQDLHDVLEGDRDGYLALPASKLTSRAKLLLKWLRSLNLD